MENLKIEYKQTSDLIKYEKNSRTHDKEQINQIVASIKEFGFTNPILIDESNIIIAGHGRLEASLKLEIKEVPTITLKNLSEAQKKAYVIADNQIALNAGWDEDLLQLELIELDELEFDYSELGFDFDFETLDDDEELEIEEDDKISKRVVKIVFPLDNNVEDIIMAFIDKMNDEYPELLELCEIQDNG